MSIGTAMLSLRNPVFTTYLIGASIMLLKPLLQPWMTVVRMLQVQAGFRSPEDARKSPVNPNPVPGQLEPNEYVERSRRLNLNDLESIPGFLIAGFLFMLTDPPLLLAQVLIWVYFVAYLTGQVHDIRATFWTFSSLPVLAMVGYVLFRASSA